MRTNNRNSTLYICTSISYKFAHILLQNMCFHNWISIMRSATWLCGAYKWGTGSIEFRRSPRSALIHLLCALEIIRVDLVRTQRSSTSLPGLAHKHNYIAVATTIIMIIIFGLAH